VELHFSEDAASKRIHAARAARKFPSLFTAVAEGRLHLTGVCLLAPHLTPENAEGLIAAAAYQTKSKIEQLLAQRFPRTELLPMVQAIPAPRAMGSAPDATGKLEPAECVGGGFGQHAPGHVEPHVPRTQVKPHAPQRFSLHVNIDQSTHDLLSYAQELLSHDIPSGDISLVLKRALQLLVHHHEKQKFAATSRPRRPRRPSTNARTIPAQVKRAVWEGDQGRCTFVSENGHRCESRKFLQFDHIDPVARGGRATVANMRLRCRGHNEYEAERIFGAEFTNQKREEARHAARAEPVAAEARSRATAEAEECTRAAAAEAGSWALAQEQARDVMACLRQLGFRAGEARRAVEFCATSSEATLEERVRAALKFLCPKTQFSGRIGTILATPA